MILNDFYQIENKSEVDNISIFDITLNPKHKIFEGHFPDQPIVPGVCTLQIIKECVESILNSETIIQSISSCKYLKAVNPIESNKIQLSILITVKDNNEIQLVANGIYQEQDFIKLKATLAKK